MKDVLARSSEAELSRFCRPGVLLGLDFDGTLAPIVDDPAAAEMRPRTRALLRDVASIRPVAVISGRSQRDVARRLEGSGVLEIIGNHGLEPGARTEEMGARISGWASALACDLSGLRGVEIEDKLFSLAVHFRRARPRAAAHTAIVAAATKLRGVRLIPGKFVVNLLPGGSAGKAGAMRTAARDLGCAAAIYVGDDETDEDVFRISASELRLLSVRVERRASSSAAYFLRTQADIDAFLGRLLALRNDT